MLSYISNKFSKDQAPQSHEPRAALFLNRFTRTSTIMFATAGVANILGITAEELMGKSFYFCIAENCLSDAVRCLESAKANDSIAYLRFWFRNPLQADDVNNVARQRSDEELDEDDGGVRIITSEVRSEATPEASPDAAIESSDSSPSEGNEEHRPAHLQVTHSHDNSRTSSGNSTDMDRRSSDGVFDRPAALRQQSSASSIDPLGPGLPNMGPTEVEAVVSCTSDGLVVILRQARPMVPQALGSTQPVNHENGIFAAPWALTPFEIEDPVTGSPPEARGPPGVEREPSSIMSAIRDVAAFAWSLTGINGAIADLAHGKPTGEAQPPGGLPIWNASANVGPEGDIWNGFSGGTHRPIPPQQKESFDNEGDGEGARITSPMKVDGPNGKVEQSIEESSSEDEIVWKRAPTMPEWRRPPRRAHRDAFGSEADAQEVEERDLKSRRRRLDGS